MSIIWFKTKLVSIVRPIDFIFWIRQILIQTCKYHHSFILDKRVRACFRMYLWQLIKWFRVNWLLLHIPTVVECRLLCFVITINSNYFRSLQDFLTTPMRQMFSVLQRLFWFPVSHWTRVPETYAARIREYMYASYRCTTTTNYNKSSKFSFNNRITSFIYTFSHSNR